jgi:hypothetical protein
VWVLRVHIDSNCRMVKNREPIDDLIDAHVWMSQQQAPNANTEIQQRTAFLKQPEYKDFQAQRAERERKQQELSITRWWWFKQREPVARFTLYLGFLTLGLVVVGTFQWCSIHSQLTQMTIATRDAEEVARLDQRAWVGVQDAISVPHSFTETSALNVIMVFSNSGKTPAQSTKIAVLSFTSPKPVFGPSADQIKALEFQPTQAIAPQGKYNFAISTGANWEPTVRARKQDTESLIAEYPLIKNGQLILYYYGMLQYADNSGHTHSTQFCIYMANPQTQEIGFCRDFNDLD